MRSVQYLPPLTRLRNTLIPVLALAVAALIAPIAALAQIEPGLRVALVVGVDDYRNLPPVTGAVADADAVADALTALGYRVSRLSDPDRRTFDGVLSAFVQQSRRAEAALVYFAGHALPAQGATGLALADDAAAQPFGLDDLAERLADPARPAALLIDARPGDLPEGQRGAWVLPALGPQMMAVIAGADASGPVARALLDQIAAPDGTLDRVADALRQPAADPKVQDAAVIASTLAAPFVLAPGAPQTAAPINRSAANPGAVGFVPPAAAPAQEPSAPLLAVPPAAPAVVDPPAVPVPQFQVPGQDIPPPPVVLDIPVEDEPPQALIVDIPVDLASAVQQELARVGCYTQRVDGAWGPGSRGALADYARRTNQTGLGDQPTPEVWLILREATGTICPPAPRPVQITGSSHGAIAFSRATYISPEGAAVGWGVSSNRGSRQQASSAAMRDCNNGDPVVTDCRVVLNFSGGCGALAVSTGSIGTGHAATGAAAQRAALRACRGSCRIVAALCTP